MKSIIASAVCSSLLLVAGCNNAEQDTITTKTTMPAEEKVALTSGISLANMDKSVRPQDNFYRYINGGWLKNTTIPSDKTAVGSFYDLRDTADDNVKAIIEELAATENLKMGSDEQKVADLFRSYMDTETRDTLGIKPIQGILDTIATLKNKDELATFLGKYQSAGISSPLAFYISVDAKDSSRYATHIWQSGLGLPDKDYYFNEAERFVKLREGYLKHIENMYNLAGLENGSEAAKTIMAIETKLAGFHWTRVESRDSAKRYNKFNVAELNTVTDAFNWDAFLEALLESEDGTVFSVLITEKKSLKLLSAEGPSADLMRKSLKFCRGISKK